MINQNELTGSALAKVIRNLFENPALLKKMKDAARKLAKPDAAGRIVDDYTKLLRGGHVQRKN